MSDTPTYDAVVAELAVDPARLRQAQRARARAWSARRRDLFGRDRQKRGSGELSPETPVPRVSRQERG